MMKSIALLLVLALLPVAGAAQMASPASLDQSPANTLKVLMNPQFIPTFPLVLALDKGYFAQAGVNVVPVINSGSSQLVIPELARGDIDLATISPSPGFFNQYALGFDAKLIASSISSAKGWNPTVWLVVKQADWDNKSIRSPRDLRGKHFDGAAPGSEAWYLSRHVLSEGALTPADLTFTQRFTSPADYILSLRNVNDVQVAYEPSVTQLEQMHVGHRWLSIADVDPGYQESFIAASAKLLQARPDAIRRFLIGYLRACKLIANAGGKWTPDMIRTLSKWSQLSPDFIAAIPTPPYTRKYGWIDVNGLERQQRYWHITGLVPTEQSINTLIDTRFITAAQKAAGVPNQWP
jgi:ABC-type nitrate/sulfonate/bicarbonate transport system substrate-binding protein